MNVDDFWAWIWEVNAGRVGRLTTDGRSSSFNEPTKRSLSQDAGYGESLFITQSNKGTWPTVSQARSLAGVLGIPFVDMCQRAELRPDSWGRKQEEIDTCLTCSLPECVAGVGDCPLNGD